MGKKRKTDPKLPPVPYWDEEEADDAIPRTTMPEEGTPEPIEEDHDSLRAFPVLDERQFMIEVCERLNNFFTSYPREALHLLNTWMPYQYELIELTREHEEQRLAEAGKLAVVDDEDLGITVGALFAALFQTQRGCGYYIRPVLTIHPSDPNLGIITGFEVVQQDEDGSARD